MKEYSIPGDASYPPTRICAKWYDDITKAYLWNSGASYCIVLINFLLRMFIILLIKRIGYSTESMQTKYIKNGVFIVSFFNTAVLLLLVNANLSQAGIPIFGGLLNGQHPDFTGEWYNDIGNNIVSAMLYIAYWPIIEFFVYWFMRLTFRVLDKGLCACGVDSTKCKTISQYVDLYSGPEYLIHYKYSAIMNMVFITFMYGAGLPILFPIALLGLFILYFTERLLVAYSYRQPPQFDEKLNKSTIEILKGAPVLYFMFGFWMFGNTQIFDHNKVMPKDTITQAQPAMHDLYNCWEINQATPFLICACITFCIVIFKKPIRYFINTYIVKYHEVTMAEEELDNYFRSLSGVAKDWWLAEERLCRDRLHFSILNDGAFQKMQQVVPGPNLIQGVASYDILANPNYQSAFEYVPAAVENRKIFIVDDDENEENNEAQSDLVRLVLNLAYLPEYQAHRFKFNKEAYMGVMGKAFGGMLMSQSIGMSINH